MKVLAIDTGGAQSSIAAVEVEGGVATVVGFTSGDEPRRLSAEIAINIDTTLSNAGWDVDQLDCIAAATGPGSWTGLRIGLATAKTLAQVSGCKLVGIPTFDIIAHCVWAKYDGDLPALLLCTSPCRADDLYAKIYFLATDMVGLIQPEWIGSAAMLADTLHCEMLAKDVTQAPVLCGGGAVAVKSEFEKGDSVEIVETDSSQLAGTLALAAFAKIEIGEGDDPLELAPIYVASSAAERNLVNIS